MTIFYHLIDQSEAFMTNKLLNNSLSILLIVATTVLIFGYMIPIIYISAWFLIFQNPDHKTTIEVGIPLLFLSVALLPLLRATKHLIINIGVEQN